MRYEIEIQIVEGKKQDGTVETKITERGEHKSKQPVRIKMQK